VQIKGTGLANRCPEVGEDVAGGSIVLDSSKNYKIAELCLEPKSWQIEEEVTRRRGDTRLGKLQPPPIVSNHFLCSQIDCHDSRPARFCGLGVPPLL
jgi:hypothetical protein